MSNHFLEELREKRKVHEVLQLRRKALELARSVIEDSPEAKGMTADEIELAACDLCDRQMNEQTVS